MELLCSRLRCGNDLRVGNNSTGLFFVKPGAYSDVVKRVLAVGPYRLSNGGETQFGTVKVSSFIGRMFRAVHRI
jgi:hypothetical protein